MSGRSIQSWKRSRGSNAAPAPRLIPAETKNQPRTNIESGTANGGTSRGMRERLRQFKGEMKIESDSNGTRILLRIPVPKNVISQDESSPESLQAAV